MSEQTNKSNTVNKIIQHIGDLNWKVTSGALLYSVAGGLLDTLQSKLANNFRDQKVKYYWDYGKGGSILNVIARKITNGAINTIAEDAISQYKTLINKSKKVTNGDKIDVKSMGAQEAYKDLQYEQSEDEAHYGYIQVKNPYKAEGHNVRKIFAYDDWGNVCVDALMLAIPVSEPVDLKFETYTLGYINNNDENIEDGARPYASDHLVWYDTTALINLSSDKNLILTQVSGRDYSRKELVSNGDLTFSVSGQITSNMPDVYPASEVQKLRQILQYKGIVEVNNEFLDQWGVKKIVIKSFSFNSSEGDKSKQEYSFEAVGIQPDAEANVTSDTIKVINYAIKEETDNQESLAWKDVLTSQLENLKSQSVDGVVLGTSLAEGYLDKIMSKL